MRTDTGQVFRLEDYRPSPYFIPETDLTFRLSPEATIVVARLTIERRDDTPIDAPLVLDGDGLLLKRLEIDGAAARACRVRGNAGRPRHRQAADGAPLHPDHRDRARACEATRR